MAIASSTLVTAMLLSPVLARSGAAQQVIQGLPPAPALPPADQYSAPASPTQPVITPQSQPTPVQPLTQPRPVTQPQPVAQPQQTAPSPQKFVVVYGDSALLLSQVQQVFAGASVQQYRGQRLIQAGSFGNTAQARQQVEMLRSRGIQAEILETSADQFLTAGATPTSTSASTPDDLLPLTPVEGEVTFGQTPSVQTAAADSRTLQAADSRSYFLVVPGDRTELSDVSSQIQRLGEGLAIASRIEERSDRRGTHLRVGPFANRTAAERWNRYLRDFGIDARVYYRR